MRCKPPAARGGEDGRERRLDGHRPLVAGDVEARHAPSTLSEGNGEGGLRRRERQRAREVDDQPRLDAVGLPRGAAPGLDAREEVVLVGAARQVAGRREAQLRPAHAALRRVLEHLVGHPLEVVASAAAARRGR